MSIANNAYVNKHSLTHQRVPGNKSRSLLNWVVSKSLGLILPIALIITWTWITKRKLFAEQLMVPLPVTWATFVDLLHSGELAINLKISLIRVLEGFAIGGSAGFILGAAMGLSKTVESYVSPFFNAIRQVPLFAWVPLLMLAVGVDEQFKIVFISVGAFYPMVINTFQGIKGVPKEFSEVASVFEYKGLTLFRKVILPGAMPSILTGIRLALSMSWMSVVGAEFIASSEGIGYMMVFARQLMQIDVVMVGVVMIGAIGLLMDVSVRTLERYLLRWRKVNAQTK